MSVNNYKSLSNISSSISKEDIRYHIQGFDNELFLASKFAWLDRWMLYLPLFVKIAPSTRPRSKYCNVFIIITVICLCVMFVASFYYYVYGDVTNSQDLTLSIAAIVGQIIIAMVRALSLIYYYFHFNYPWYTKLASFSSNTTELQCTNNNKNCICIVKHYKSMIKLYIFMYMIAFMLIFIGYIIFNHVTNTVYQTIYLIDFSFYIIFSEVPAFFTIIIQSTICFKYYWFLSQLMNNMGDNMNVNHVFVDYKSIYNAFKKDYNFYLKWSVIFYIAEWLIDMFIGSINPIYSADNDTTGVTLMMFGSVVHIFTQISLYIISAALLSETFQSFQELLWMEMNGFIGDENKFQCQSILTALIVYSTKYPINISFAGLLVTRRNIMLFTIGYVAARVAAELVALLQY